MACVGAVALIASLLEGSVGSSVTCGAAAAGLACGILRSPEAAAARFTPAAPGAYNGSLLLEAARLHANTRRSAHLRRRPARSGALRRAAARGRPLYPTHSQHPGRPSGAVG